MKIKHILILPLLFGFSFNAFAVELPVKDPSTLQVDVRASSALLSRAMDVDGVEQRYRAVQGFMKMYGEWVILSAVDGTTPRIHISSYLLKMGHEDVASALLKNGAFDGWLTYQFAGGVVSDFQFAIEDGNVEYLSTLFSVSPSGLNTPMTIMLGSEPALPLAILASSKHAKSKHYEKIIYAMLNAGANPHQKMSTGVTPMLVASSGNNVKFIRVVQNFLEGQSSNMALMLKNTPLQSNELIEMQAIADALLETPQSEKDSIPYDRLHDTWIQMILKGYNTAAEVFYLELKRRPEFEIDMQTKKGLNAMMAASMSTLYGGNVEYVSRLVDRGADVSFTINIPGDDGEIIQVGYLQLAFTSDNYKVVAQLISSGINFVHAPDNVEIPLVNEAYEQNAFLSATVIKHALSVAYSRQKEISDTQ
jgi:ankyrin repeat protein